MFEPSWYLWRSAANAVECGFTRLIAATGILQHQMQSELAHLQKRLAFLECPIRVAETRRACVEAVTVYSQEAAARVHKNTLLHVQEMQNALNSETMKRRHAETMATELEMCNKQAEQRYAVLEAKLAALELKNSNNKKRCLAHVVMLEDEISELHASQKQPGIFDDPRSEDCLQTRTDIDDCTVTLDRHEYVDAYADHHHKRLECLVHSDEDTELAWHEESV